MISHPVNNETIEAATDLDKGKNGSTWCTVHCPIRAMEEMRIDVVLKPLDIGRLLSVIATALGRRNLDALTID